MKLICRGNYAGEEQLPTADLPRGAVRFEEPDTPEQLIGKAAAFLVPAGVLVAVVMLFAAAGKGPGAVSVFDAFYLPAIFASLLTVVPHELLHGICFGRNARVELFWSLKYMMAFVISTEPVSKARFIAMSLCPNLVFGWIPLLIWAFVPFDPGVSRFLLSFSVMCISYGIGDYMNVWNALRQMPRGSMQQLSGFHSYWYIPDLKKDAS